MAVGDLRNTIASGTAFPGSPADGEPFFRTDRGLLYYYNAAAGLWLGPQWTIGISNENTVPVGVTNTTIVRAAAATNGASIWLDSFEVGMKANGTPNATNYFTVALLDGLGATLASFNNGNDPPNAYVGHSVAIQAAHDAIQFRLAAIVTGSPPSIYLAARVMARTIG